MNKREREQFCNTEHKIELYVEYTGDAYLFIIDRAGRPVACGYGDMEEVRRMTDDYTSGSADRRRECLRNMETDRNEVFAMYTWIVGELVDGNDVWEENPREFLLPGIM